MTCTLANSICAIVAVAAVVALLPDEAEARECVLVVLCFPLAPQADPPPPAGLPAAPSPIPTLPAGPPTPPPPGNPRCVGRPRKGGGVFVGVGDAVSADPEDRRCTLATMVASGVRIVRSTFHWSLIEPEPRKFDFRYYDAYVGQLSRYRVRVLPILIGSPRFYSSAPNARFPDRAQPRRNRDFARFARVLTLRYGPRGSFWRANPALPRLPIRSWQVWNEPNLRIFWNPRPSPRAYVRMLKAVTKSVRRVDRRAEIVAGGLPESQFGMSVGAYVRGMYRAGGARWFDTLAIHPYSRTAAEALKKVRRLRRLMDRNRDRRARIWVTEFGWPSGGPRHRFRVGRRGQARRVAHVLRGLWRQRHRLRIRGANHVMWRDPPLYRSDTWGLHLGLYTRHAKPKPAAKAFKAAARKMR